MVHKISMLHEGGARTDYLSVAVARSNVTEATCNKMKCKHVQVLHFYISSQFNEEAVSRKRRRIPKFKLCHGMEHHAHEILISDVCTVSINLWT